VQPLYKASGDLCAGFICVLLKIEPAGAKSMRLTVAAFMGFWASLPF
jgi:hypothetical protein